MDTSNDESHIIKACGPDTIYRCDGMMGYNPEARQGPTSSAGIPQSQKDKAESLWHQQTSGWWLTRLSLHLPFMPGSKVHGSVEANEKVANV